MGTATKTNPELWERCKRDAKARMGGKHSARAMQLATQLYKKRGGGYSGKKPTAKTNSLKKWGKQKWKWSGGEKKKTAAMEQGGRGVYLPEDKIERLKSSKEGKKRLAAAAAKKSKANSEGRQYSSHGLAAGTSLKSKKASSTEARVLHALKVEGGAAGMEAIKKRVDAPDLKQAMSSLMKKGKIFKHKDGDIIKKGSAKKLKKIVKELYGASKMHKGQAERIQAMLGKMKTSAAKRDPRLARAGVSGYNKSKRTPSHPTKSHIVVAKEGDRVKTIRFGQQGVKTNQTAGQRKAFKSRHQKNIAKGKMSAAYWADKAKWSPSKTKDKKNQKWVKGTKTASAWTMLAYRKGLKG